MNSITTFNKALLSTIIGMICTLAFSDLNNDKDYPTEDIKLIIKAINNYYDDASTISYVAERKTTTPNGTYKDSWLFAYSRPGYIRIEYNEPSSRLIIKNKDVIWEYIASQNAAMKTDLSESSPEEKAETIQNMLKRIAIPGLRPGNYDQLLALPFTTKSSGNILTVFRSEKPLFTLKIDTEKKILLYSEIHNEQGELEIKSIPSKHKLVADTFWMPQRIQNTIRTDGNYISSDIRISGAKAEANLPADFFVFKQPQNLKIIEK